MDEKLLGILGMYSNIDEKNHNDVLRLCELLNIQEEEAIETILFAKEMCKKHQKNKNEQKRFKNFRTTKEKFICNNKSRKCCC